MPVVPWRGAVPTGFVASSGPPEALDSKEIHWGEDALFAHGAPRLEPPAPLSVCDSCQESRATSFVQSPDSMGARLSQGSMCDMRSISLLPTWAEDARDDIGLKPLAFWSSEKLYQYPTNAVRVGDQVSSSGWLSSFVISPSSRIRLTWDLLTFVAMGYDMVFLPLQAFQPPRHHFMAVMEWATTVFWCVDMFLSFFSGFQEGGLVEMRWSKVARRYFRTWFVFDFIVVALDWVILLQMDQVDADMLGLARLGKYGKVIRLMRILRMVRLIRLVKVMSILVEFSDFLHSETMQTIFGLAKLILATAALNHCIACAWYLVGTLEIYDWSWVQQLSVNARVDVDYLYSYLTALHWALTQFMPASMEVVPQNSVERAFSVGMVIVALLCASSFISSITASMTHLRRINEAQHRQQELARKYITDHRVQLELGNRVLGFVRQHINGKRGRVHEDNVEAFKALPESLRIELHAEVYMPTLLPHPLFFHHHQFGEREELAMICHNAMTEKTLMSDHELSSVGQQATAMAFVIAGSAEYNCQGEFRESFQAGGSLFEAALWLNCFHTGNLRALQICELFLLDAERFGKCASRCQVAMCYRSYAAMFAAHVPSQDGLLSRRALLWSSFDILQEMAQRAFEDLAAAQEAARSQQRPSFSRAKTTTSSWISWRARTGQLRWHMNLGFR